MNIFDKVWGYNYPPIVENTSKEDLARTEGYTLQPDAHQTMSLEDLHMRIPPAIPVKK